MMEKVGVILLCIVIVTLVAIILISARKLLNRYKPICIDSDNGGPRPKKEVEKPIEISCKHTITQSYQQSRPAFILDRGITVTVQQGDITDEDVDAIVNAANGRLQHGGGVARAIALKAGDGINQEGQRELSFRKGRELKVSEVLHTGGYKLPAKYVIHAVGPIRGQDNPFQFLLKKTFLNCLEYAELKLDVTSIAIPLISSGIFGGSKDECAESLVHAVIDFSRNREFKNVNEIRLVNIDAEATRAIDRLFTIEQDKMKQK